MPSVLLCVVGASGGCADSDDVEGARVWPQRFPEGHESGDGQSTRTQNDVDSEVSFEDDAHEEIETTVIEEEDWIEYIRRSTEDAMEKMERAKIRCWNRTHKK